jgi:hypothetical protein
VSRVGCCQCGVLLDLRVVRRRVILGLDTIHVLCDTLRMVNEVINAIGNVVESSLVGGVLYTLAADAIVRTNDEDTGYNVDRVKFTSFDGAKVAYDKVVADAIAVEWL